MGEGQVFFLPEDALVLPICLQDALTARRCAIAALKLHFYNLCWEKDQAPLLLWRVLPYSAAAGGARRSTLFIPT